MADEKQGTSQAPAPKRVPLRVSAARTVDAEEEAADRKSMGQVRNTFILLGIVAVAYVVYLMVTGQVDEFVSSLRGVDTGWVIAGVVCFLFYYVFGVLAYVLSVVGDPDCPVGFRDLMSVEASGVFFMRMTPSGAGSAPAQIFRLTRAGMSVGEAGALQFTRSVLYEAGEGIFAGIMLLFRGSYFYETFGDVTMIGLLLFGVKIVQVGAMLALCLLPRPVKAIGNWGLRFAHRRNWLKDDKYEEYYTFVNTQIDVFSAAFREACSNVPELVWTLVVTLLQLGCMYALPWFVLRAFGENADFLTCLASGSMIELLVNAVPLPGGTGGAEVGFSYLFGNIFGTHLAAGLVIWRAIEYLLPVIIAAPCMGMRSTGGESISRRWTRLRARLRAPSAAGRDVERSGASGTRRGGRSRRGGGGVTIRPGQARRR